MRENLLIKFALLFILLVFSFLMSLFFGGSESVLNNSETSAYIFYEIRLPKSITALVAGATLSLSGLVLQILFRNPLAGPYVLGISSGASVMVALCLLAGVSFPLISGQGFTVAAAIVGSALVTFLILGIASKLNNNVILLLIGLMISQICAAIETALEYYANPGNLKNFVLWGMGSLSSTTVSDLPVFAGLGILFIAILFFFAKPMAAMLFGQEYAISAGINYWRCRTALILIASALTGLTTAYCGPLAFVGIAVPILSRMIIKTSKPQVHLFSCILTGGSVLLLSDLVCHSLVKNVTLPVNTVTTIIGAPLVIYLMFRNKYW